MPRITVKGKKYRLVKIKNPKKLPLGSAILIPSKGGSKVPKKRKKSRKRLPPRVKTGIHKGEFRKRKKRK